MRPKTAHPYRRRRARASGIADDLSFEGRYDVNAVEDGTALDLYLSRQSVDMVILDLMLPGEDGLSIGRRLRQQRNLPIIILSARGEEFDRIVGLEMGADDYLTAVQPEGAAGQNPLGVASL